MHLLVAASVNTFDAAVQWLGRDTVSRFREGLESSYLLVCVAFMVASTPASGVSATSICWKGEGSQHNMTENSSLQRVVLLRVVRVLKKRLGFVGLAKAMFLVVNYMVNTSCSLLTPFGFGFGPYMLVWF